MTLRIPRRLVRAEQVLAARTRDVTLVLESSQDPHNVHAVLRTAEALGIQEVHLVAPRGEAAAIAPGVTQGAHDWLTVRRHEDIRAAAAQLREEGRTLWAACPDEDATPLTGLTPEGPVAVLLGNETDGLTEAARTLADRSLRIDMVGFSGSLNLSVSAAIILWELRRGAVRGPAPGDLGADARRALRERWYRKLLGGGRNEEAVRGWLDRADEVAAAAAGQAPLPPRDRRGEA